MDDGTRKVVADVVRRCREGGFDVTPTLACLMTRTMQLQGVALEEKASQESLEDFSAECSRRLTQHDCPSLETLKMHIAVEEANVLHAKSASKATRDREERSATMEREIVNTTVEGAPDEMALLDELYRAVFRYVCVSGGMEISERGSKVLQTRWVSNVRAPLREGLRRFTGLGSNEKSSQLKELASIVLGIRVFNRSIGKGGRRLEDPSPGYLSQASKLREDLVGATTILISTERLLAQYGSVIAFKSQSTRPSEPIMARLRDEQTNRMAYAATLRRLIDGCSKGAAVVASLADQLAREIGVVQQLVGAKSSVPKTMSSPRVECRSPLYAKEKVYPRLDALGALHMALAEERRAQVVLQRVADRLIDFAKPFKTTLTNQLLHEASAAAAQGPGEAAPPLLEDAGPAAAVDPAAGAAAAGAEIMEGGVTLLEYGGYDLFALVKRAGMALPAHPALGAVVAFSGKMFGFATKEHATQFAAQPEAFIKSAMERLRAQPELIYLTGASDEFPTVAIPPIVDMMTTPQSCDFGTQTPTHFVEKNVDKDYEWNEWALRRRALHLVNLRQKSTHGAQTHLSHFRRENTTQVWLPKQSTTQTAVAKGTAMPQMKRYIGGLRGGPEVKMNVVSISLDIGQPHQF